MSDQSLGSLSAKLELNTAGLDTSVGKAIGGLAKVEASAAKTEKEVAHVGKTMQKALAGEVIVNATNRIGSTISQLGDRFKGLGHLVTGFGAIMQGLFQQGVLGAGIAAVGVAVSAVTEALGEAQRNAAAVAASWQKDLEARLSQLGEIEARTSAISRDIAAASGTSAAARTSMATGLSTDTAAQFAALDQAELRKASAQAQFGLAQRGARGGGELAQQDLKVAAARLAEAAAHLTKLELELGAQTDKERADSLRRVNDEREAKRAAKREAMLNALGEARNYRPAGLRTPGEEARLAREADAFGIDGSGTSIRDEAKARALRDAEYKANGSGETLRLDKPLSRTTFLEKATEVSDQILDEAFEFADSVNEAFGAAGAALAEVAGALAPKTAAVIDGAIKGSAAGPIGAAIGAIGAALANSAEFQAVGKALDSGVVQIINAISEVLRPAVPVITMAIKLVVEAVKIIMGVVDIVASALQLDTVFAIVFEALKFLAAILSVGAAAVQYALDGLQNAFKNAAIGFLSLGIFAGAFQTQVDDLKKSLVVQGDFGAEMAKTWDSVMKIGFNAEIAAVGLGDAADAAQKVAQSFLNLPAGFKTAAAIYNATGASGEAFGGFAPPTASGMPPLAAAAGAGGAGSGGSGSGDVFNFYGPIYVSGDEGFTNVVTVSARQSGMTGSGSPAGRPPPQRPTPYPPNGTQPYTPVP